MSKIVSGKAYTLMNANSLTVLTLKGGSNKEKTPVLGQVMQINAGDNAYQNAVWTFTAVDESPGYYKLSNRASGTFLGTLDGNNKSGTPLVGTKENLTSDMVKWALTEVPAQSASCYVLTNKSGAQNTPVVIDLAHGSSTPGTIAQIYSRYTIGDNNNQVWMAIPIE